MALQTPIVRDLDAAEYEFSDFLPLWALGSERVRVVPDPDAHAQPFLPRMRIARCAAFLALSIPTVATGTPGGTCTVASSASRPLSRSHGERHADHGQFVSDAAKPGNAADSPAPAMITLNP